MTQIQTLQEQLEKKAEKELDDDIKKAVELFYSNPILKQMREFESIYIKKDEKSEQLRIAIWDSKSTIFQAIKEKLLPERKNMAVLEFVSKIQDLENEVAELRGQFE